MRRTSTRSERVTAPGLVCVDHQPLGFGTLDRDGLLAATQLRFELSADDVVIVRSVQVDGPAVLALHYAETATEVRSRYEREALYVLRVDAEGLIDRWEVFAPDRYADALARLHELGAPSRGPVVENAASRTIRRALALLNAQDWDGLAELDAVAEHVVRLDRRKLVAAPPLEGAEAYGVNAVGFLDVFDTVDAETVAVRGERLALVRLHCGREPDFVLRLLCLYELDEHGRIAWEADFDDDDLAAALRELDDRYVAGEGAPHERVLRIGRAFGDANDRRDFGAMRSMLANDFVMADRTRLGYGDGDRDYFDAASRSVTEVATAGLAVNRMLMLDGDALLTVAEGHQITPEGNDYVWTSCIVFQVGADDRIRRAEYYDEDRYADALVRLHELSRSDRADGPPIGNAMTRVEREATDAMAHDDRARMRELVAAEFRFDDRRGLVNLGRLDGAGLTENLVLMRAQGYVIGAPEPVAVRGRRLALSRRVARTPAGDESPVLALNELDEAGRWVAMTFFDEDALGDALDELDDRYAAGEGAGDAYTVRRTSDLRHAMAAHDWSAVEALVGDDFVFSDHRPIGLPDADRAGYLAAMAASAEQTPNAVLVGRALEVRGDVTLIRTHRVGATAEGFEYAWEQLAVSRWAGGLLRRVELFPLDDAAAAHARFVQLAEPRVTKYVDNDAVRTVARAYWLRRFVGPRAAAPARQPRDRRGGPSPHGVDARVPRPHGIRGGDGRDRRRVHRRRRHRPPRRPGRSARARAGRAAPRRRRAGGAEPLGDRRDRPARPRDALRSRRSRRCDRRAGRPPCRDPVDARRRLRALVRRPPARSRRLGPGRGGVGGAGLRRDRPSRPRLPGGRPRRVPRAQPVDDRGRPRCPPVQPEAPRRRARRADARATSSAPRRTGRTSRGNSRRSSAATPTAGSTASPTSTSPTGTRPSRSSGSGPARPTARPTCRRSRTPRRG